MAKPKKPTQEPTNQPEAPEPEVADNWAERRFMICDTCMFYVQKKGTIGRCRKNPPTIDGWPVVYFDDWCGNHKLDADKMQ